MRGFDPRVRVLFAAAVSVVVATTTRSGSILTGLFAGATAAVLCGMSWRVFLRRLLPLNGFMLALVLMVPWSAAGEPLFVFGGMVYSREGLAFALMAMAKANVILLLICSLLGTMSLTTFGHSLAALGVPRRLALLFLLTVRYVDVLHREYGQLRRAMKARGFEAGLDRHTLHSLGHLVGMLLVRSLDRSERIMAAMKCRGFAGDLHLIHRFRLCRRDAAFVVACGVVIGTMLWTELTGALL